MARVFFFAEAGMVVAVMVAELSLLTIVL